jgi:hypothetical protein
LEVKLALLFRSPQSSRVAALMAFISYAQNYEDLILWREVEQGLYVDVGAADPEEWSATRAFCARGWPRINVEPLHEYFEKLTKARLRDTDPQAPGGREARLSTLHTFGGSGLSSLVPRANEMTTVRGDRPCD